MRAKLICCIGIGIAVAGAVAAQTIPVTVQTIDVRFTGGDHCKEVSKVSVIVNEQDRDSVTLKRVDDCHWSDTTPRINFYPRMPFSLRLGGARTDCHYAKERPKPPNESVLELTYRYPSKNAQDIQLLPQSSGTEPVFLGYVRVVRRDLTAGEDSVACKEHGVFDNGEQPKIRDVSFGREELRLQFLETPQQFVLDNPGLLVNHPEVLKKKKGNKIVLSREDVEAALRAQGVGKGRLARPRDPPNQRDNDKGTLAAIGLAGLVITVP